MRRPALRAVLALCASGLLAGACSPQEQRAAPSAAPVSMPQASRAAVGFCSAWDAYGAVLLAVAAAPDPSRAAELEVLSASVLVSAVEQVGAGWPAELVGERSLVLADIVGPYLRRAHKALAALVEQGASDDDVRELALAWREAQATRAGDGSAAPLDWLESLSVPARLRDLVDAAGRRFAAQVTAFGDDPTLPGRRALVQRIDTPRTDAYLAANCPGIGATVAAIHF